MFQNMSTSSCFHRFHTLSILYIYWVVVLKRTHTHTQRTPKPVFGFIKLIFPWKTFVGNIVGHHHPIVHKDTIRHLFSGLTEGEKTPHMCIVN